MRQSSNEDHHPVRVRRWGDSRDDFERNEQLLATGKQRDLGETLFRQDSKQRWNNLSQTVSLGEICYISYGLRAGADDRYWKGEFTTNDVVSDVCTDVNPRPFVEGKDLARWRSKRTRFLEWGTERAPSKFARKTFPELHENPGKLIAMRTPGRVPKVIYDDTGLHFDSSSVGIVPWHQLAGVRNKSIRKTAKYQSELNVAEQETVTPRDTLENQSREFLPMYLLALLNSKFAEEWLIGIRRSKRHIYPNDWKDFPVAHASAKEQEHLADIAELCIDAAMREDDRELESLELALNTYIAQLYSYPTRAEND